MDPHGNLRLAIQDATDPLTVMQRVVDHALALIPAAEGAVVELADDAHLTYSSTSGSLARSLGVRLRADTSLSGLAMRTGCTLSCEDAERDPRVDRDACRRVGAVSMICVPLTRGAAPFGVLKVTTARREAFTPADVETLTALADFITAAIGAATDLARITGELFSGPAEGVPEFVANVLQPGIVADFETRRRIEQTLEDAAFAIVLQPVRNLASGALVGAEALARFTTPPRQGPDSWFADAQRVGRGTELELATLTAALQLADQLPAGAFLAVNIGPDAIADPSLPGLLEAAGPERIVLELTEHMKVDDYDRLRGALCRIRAQGARLAIDDTGAGFASLAHILKLAPDLIKLDRALTGGIDLDPVRRALAQALVRFAAETGAQVVAEGIETEDELATVRALGIAQGQGYLLGRPAPPAALAAQTGSAAPA